VERLFSGTVDGAEVHPCVVVRRALALNASAVLLAHNQPSGNIEPSAADRALTVRLKAALTLMDIRLFDHFVVSAAESVSMADSGWV
jgi:DNA repair protein RadC